MWYFCSVSETYSRFYFSMSRFKKWSVLSFGSHFLPILEWWNPEHQMFSKHFYSYLWMHRLIFESDLLKVGGAIFLRKVFVLLQWWRRRIFLNGGRFRHWNPLEKFIVPNFWTFRVFYINAYVTKMISDRSKYSHFLKEEIDLLCSDTYSW